MKSGRYKCVCILAGLATVAAGMSSAAAPGFKVRTSVFQPVPPVPDWYFEPEPALREILDGAGIPGDIAEAVLTDQAAARIITSVVATARARGNRTRVVIDSHAGPPWRVRLSVISKVSISGAGDMKETRDVDSKSVIAEFEVSRPASPKDLSRRRKISVNPTGEIGKPLPDHTKPALPGPVRGICSRNDPGCNAETMTRLIELPRTPTEKLLIERETARTDGSGYFHSADRMTPADLAQPGRFYREQMKSLGSDFPGGVLDDVTQENFGLNMGRLPVTGPSLPPDPDQECSAQFNDCSDDVIPTLACTKQVFNYSKWVRDDFLAMWSKIPLFNPQNIPFLGSVARAYIKGRAGLAAVDRVYRSVWVGVWMDRVAAQMAVGNEWFLDAAVESVLESAEERSVLTRWLTDKSSLSGLNGYEKVRQVIFDEHIADLLPDALWPDNGLPRLDRMPDRLTWVTCLAAKSRRPGRTAKSVIAAAMDGPDGSEAKEILKSAIPWLSGNPRYRSFAAAVKAEIVPKSLD